MSRPAMQRSSQVALLQVARNVVIGLVGQAISLSFQLVASILVARRLGAVEFGIYSSALAFAILFSTLADAGVTNGLTRELVVVEDSHAGKLLGAGLLIKAIGGIAVYLLALGAALAFGFRGDQLVLIAVMLFAYQFSLLTQTAIGVGRARGRMEIESGLVSLQGAIFLGWVLLAPAAPISFGVGWLLAYIASSLIGMAVICLTLVRPRLALSMALARQLWAVGLPLMISAVLMLVYTRLLIYQLTLLSSARETGLFNAVSGMIRNLQVFTFILSAAVGPTLARMVIASPERIGEVYTLALRVILLIIVPVAVGASALARPITLTLFGAEYVPAATALALSAWSLAGFSLSFIAQALLAAQVRAGRWARALGAGIAVSATVGAVAIPRAGASGAALAALAADICILGLMIWETRASIRWPNIIATGLRVGASAAMMGLAVVLLVDQPLWVSVPLGAVIYLVLILLTRTISPAEIANLSAGLPLPGWMKRRLGSVEY
ncbi:MAG: oligosaccharide flippase family protein [Oscillochloris sp.]|nr:oligosaccharide flippase family protein [Oscillochloris sp.]